MWKWDTQMNCSVEPRELLRWAERIAPLSRENCSVEPRELLRWAERTAPLSWENCSIEPRELLWLSWKNCSVDAKGKQRAVKRDAKGEWRAVKEDAKRRAKDCEREQRRNKRMDNSFKQYSSCGPIDTLQDEDVLFEINNHTLGVWEARVEHWGDCCHKKEGLIIHPIQPSWGSCGEPMSGMSKLHAMCLTCPTRDRSRDSTNLKDQYTYNLDVCCNNLYLHTA